MSWARSVGVARVRERVTVVKSAPRALRTATRQRRSAARRRAGYEKTPYATLHSASHETSQKHMHLTAQDHNTEPAGVRILHSVLTYHSTRLIR